VSSPIPAISITRAPRVNAYHHQRAGPATASSPPQNFTITSDVAPSRPPTPCRDNTSSRRSQRHSCRRPRHIQPTSNGERFTSSIASGVIARWRLPPSIRRPASSPSPINGRSISKVRAAVHVTVQASDGTSRTATFTIAVRPCRPVSSSLPLPRSRGVVASAGLHGRGGRSRRPVRDLYSQRRRRRAFTSSATASSPSLRAGLRTKSSDTFHHQGAATPPAPHTRRHAQRQRSGAGDLVRRHTSVNEAVAAPPRLTAVAADPGGGPSPTRSPAPLPPPSTIKRPATRNRHHQRVPDFETQSSIISRQCQRASVAFNTEAVPSASTICTPYSSGAELAVNEGLRHTPRSIRPGGRSACAPVPILLPALDCRRLHHRPATGSSPINGVPELRDPEFLISTSRPATVSAPSIPRPSTIASTMVPPVISSPAGRLGHEGVAAHSASTHGRGGRSGRRHVT